MTPDPGLPYSACAYGHTLVSDIALDQAPRALDTTLETITIQQGDDLPKPPPEARQIGPFSFAAPGYLSIDVAGLVHLVALAGKTLLYRAAPGLDPSLLQVFLSGTGLAAVLMQRGLLVLRGSAVEVNGESVLCIGPSGVGTSSAALGLMQRGYRVISDTLCVVDGAGRLLPGLPHVALWQEAATLLGLPTQGLTRLRPELEKFRLPLGPAFCAAPCPVARIYVLASSMSTEITCTPLAGRETFVALNDNTYRPTFVDGLGISVPHFQRISALTRQARMAKIVRPTQAMALDEVADLVLADATGARP